MLFKLNENDLTITLHLVPQPKDRLSVQHLIEELEAIQPEFPALPALQMLYTTLKEVSGESLPPTLQP